MKKYILLLFSISCFAQFNPAQWYSYGKKNITADITSNLVKYWKFNNNMTDEIDAQTPNAQASITYVTGKINESSVFNGTSSYATYNADADLNMSTGSADVPFSVSFWAKPTSFSGEARIIEHNQSTSSQFQWQIGRVNGNGAFSIWIFSQSNTVGSDYKLISVNAILNEWHHYVCTYNGNLTQGIKWYRDGVLLNSTATVSGSYTGMRNLSLNYAIGRRAAQTFSYYTGEIDDLAVYRRKLSHTDVIALYNKGLSGLPIQ